MLVLLLFSSTHLFSIGFRSEDWNGHSRRLVLCSVTHFCVVSEVCVGIIERWKIQTWLIIRFLTESVTYWFFICWYLIESIGAFPLHGTARYGSGQFTFGGFSTGYSTWYLVLVLVPPRPRFQVIRTVTKTWRVNSTDHWLAGKNVITASRIGRNFCLNKLFVSTKKWLFRCLLRKCRHSSRW